MGCDRQFPLWTAIYNWATIGGAIVLGVVVMGQFGVWTAVGHAALLMVGVIGVLGTVCARCSYHGSRCALGLGRAAGLVFRKGDEGQFFGTSSQRVITSLLVVGLVLPVVGGGVLLVRGAGVGSKALVGGMFVLLLAGLIPQPRLVCRHCCQGESGACPVGKLFRS